MTETEVTAVHGSATVESVEPAQRRDGSVAPGARDRRVRDDRRRAVHRGGGRDARASTPPATCCAAPGRRRCDGHLAWPLSDREPHLLETVRPGVFAAGDVRAGASNRVAGAVGDGAMVVRFAHDVLAG